MKPTQRSHWPAPPQGRQGAGLEHHQSQWEPSAASFTGAFFKCPAGGAPEPERFCRRSVIHLLISKKTKVNFNLIHLFLLVLRFDFAEK